MMGLLENGSVVGTRSGYPQLPAGGRGSSGRKRTNTLEVGAPCALLCAASI